MWYIPKTLRIFILVIKFVLYVSPMKCLIIHSSLSVLRSYFTWKIKQVLLYLSVIYLPCFLNSTVHSTLLLSLMNKGSMKSHMLLFVYYDILNKISKIKICRLYNHVSHFAFDFQQECYLNGTENKNWIWFSL